MGYFKTQSDKMYNKLKQIIMSIVSSIQMLVTAYFGNENQSKTNGVEENVVFDDGITTLWDEFIIRDEDKGQVSISQDVPLGSYKAKLEALKKTRGFTVFTKGQCILNININIITVPVIQTIDTEVNQCEKLISQEGKVALRTTVKLPMGNVDIITTTSVEHMNMAEICKWYSMNPYLYCNMQLNKSGSLYAKDYTNASASVYVKVNQGPMDKLILTKVHICTSTVFVVNKGRINQVNVIAMIVPVVENAVYIGSFIMVGKVAFIAYSYSEITTIDHILLYAASLTLHDVRVNVKTYKGPQI